MQIVTDSWRKELWLLPPFHGRPSFASKTKWRERGSGPSTSTCTPVVLYNVEGLKHAGTAPHGSSIQQSEIHGNSIVKDWIDDAWNMSSPAKWSINRDLVYYCILLRFLKPLSWTDSFSCLILVSLIGSRDLAVLCLLDHLKIIKSILFLWKY